MLGVGGAAFLETAKTFVDLAFAGRPQVEAAGTGIVIYGVMFVVTVLLAGLSLRTSPGAFALYALPVGLLGVVFTALVVLLVAFVGLVPTPQTGDWRVLGRAVQVLGLVVVLLAGVIALRQMYGPMFQWIGRKITSPMTWLRDHALAVLFAAGVFLLVLGTAFNR